MLIKHLKAPGALKNTNLIFNLTLFPVSQILSVRAKSCLRDTITQTLYYHVCVILCNEGVIQSITSK